MRCCVLTRQSNVKKRAKSLSTDCRIAEPLESLSHSAGWEVTYSDVEEPDARLNITWADAIFLNKHMSRAALSACMFARDQSKQVIYDIDDLIFNFPNYSGGSPGTESHEGKLTIDDFLQCATHITVSNESLKAVIADKGFDAHLIPNGIWLDRYAVSKHSDAQNINRFIFANADKIKLETRKHEFLQALADFLKLNHATKMDFYGDYPQEIAALQNINVTSRQPFSKFMTEICATPYNFAVVPLGGFEDPDSFSFNSMKSPFKFLNYGCARIPGIYSNSPIYTNIIDHGITGLIVENTQSEWLQAMLMLERDHALRTKIANNAFELVEQKFNITEPSAAIQNLISKH